MWSHSSILQQREVGGDAALLDVVEDALGVVGLDAAQDRRAAARACQTLTSGSSEQAPKQPTAARRMSRPSRSMACGEGLVDALGAVAAAAGAHADGDARGGRKQLGEPGFADGVERPDILDAAHSCLSWARASTSRVSWCVVHMAADAVVEFDDGRHARIGRSRRRCGW